MCRYKIEYGRFGAYFYDKKSRKDLDLLTVLIKLQTLENYIVNQKKPFILCLFCKSNPNNCSNYNFHLENPSVVFDYCNCYKTNK